MWRVASHMCFPNGTLLTLRWRHKQNTAPGALAGQAATDKWDEYSDGTAPIWAHRQVGLNEHYQISRCEKRCFFFFNTKYCWQRVWWQSWHKYSVCCIPSVHCAAHVAIPCQNIYSLSCSSVYVWVRVCVWRGAGGERGSKSPAGVWGKKQQEAENPCCLWINVSKQEARHHVICASVLYRNLSQMNCNLVPPIYIQSKTNVALCTT